MQSDIQRQLCIRKTAFNVLHLVTVIGFALMMVFGIIDIIYAKDYPYVQSDADNSLKLAYGVCDTFPECASNCSVWNMILSNSTGYQIDKQCSGMCSDACVIRCQACLNVCVRSWNDYFNILPSVGSGTHYIRGQIFTWFGMSFSIISLFMLPPCRKNTCPMWGLDHEQLNVVDRRIIEN